MCVIDRLLMMLIAAVVLIMVMAVILRFYAGVHECNILIVISFIVLNCLTIVLMLYRHLFKRN